MCFRGRRRPSGRESGSRRERTCRETGDARLPCDSRRRCHRSSVATLATAAAVRGPTRLISPRRTFHSDRGSSSRLDTPEEPPRPWSPAESRAILKAWPLISLADGRSARRASASRVIERNLTTSNGRPAGGPKRRWRKIGRPSSRTTAGAIAANCGAEDQRRPRPRDGQVHQPLGGEEQKLVIRPGDQREDRRPSGSLDAPGADRVVDASRIGIRTILRFLLCHDATGRRSATTARSGRRIATSIDDRGVERRRRGRPRRGRGSATDRWSGDGRVHSSRKPR